MAASPSSVAVASGGCEPDARVAPAVRLLLSEGVVAYRQIVGEVTELLGRRLLRAEKALLTQLIHARHDDEPSAGNGSPTRPTGAQQAPEDPPRVLMVTAFSTNYVVGHVCSAVNELYARAHGHGWLAEVMSLDEMMDAIHPRGHGTWFKVALINRLLAQQQQQQAVAYTHIMWVDADAVVVNFSKSVSELLAKAAGADLVIAEDMTPNCLVNAGVMLIRCSAWSRALWGDLWHEDWVRRYWTQQPYEQAALLRWLDTHQEGLQQQQQQQHGTAAAKNADTTSQTSPRAADGAGAVSTDGDLQPASKEDETEETTAATAAAALPFHSFRGGRLTKRTRHVYVVPHTALNTNMVHWQAGCCATDGRGGHRSGRGWVAVSGAEEGQPRHESSQSQQPGAMSRAQPPPAMDGAENAAATTTAAPPFIFHGVLVPVIVLQPA
jgi:hypothetical protein